MVTYVQRLHFWNCYHMPVISFELLILDGACSVVSFCNKILAMNLIFWLHAKFDVLSPDRRAMNVIELLSHYLIGNWKCQYRVYSRCEFDHHCACGCLNSSPLDKMAAIAQTIFWIVFCDCKFCILIKMCAFPRVLLTITQQWFT